MSGSPAVPVFPGDAGYTDAMTRLRKRLVRQ
jgi:hypothetical protein